MEPSVEPTSMKPTVDEACLSEVANTMADEEEASGENGRAGTQGICPIVFVGVRSDVDRLCRQRVDLRR